MSHGSQVERRCARRSAAPGGARILALALGLLAAGLARAAETERALLPVSVNQVEKGTFLVLRREGDVLMRVADLSAAGVRGFSGQREAAGGEEYVSLASLAPEVAFELDAEALTLGVKVPPAYLGTSVVDLGFSRPAGIAYSKDTSAFFNYALNGQDFDTFDAFGEAGVSVRGNLFYTGASRTPDGDFVRGLTNYTQDDRKRLQRWVVGDTFASAGILGGALFMGGVSLSRNFDLDPYFVRFPSLTVSGAVTTPSTVDVYVNGSLVRREQLPPGQFDLKNLVVPAGSAQAQVVIRDAFGQERTLTSPFYASPAVLAKGLSEYTYNLGFRRQQLGTRSADYGSLAFLGRHRFGLSDDFTPEVRLEADSDVLSGGPGLAVRLPFGEVDGAFALSRDQGRSGTAGSLAYRYISRPLSVGFLARSLSRSYANLTFRADDDRPRFETDAFAGTRLGPRLGLTVQYTAFEMRDAAERTERLALLGSVAITRGASLVLSGARTRRDGEIDNGVFAGVSCVLGRGTTASVSHDRQEGSGATSLSVQRSLPLGTGFGYRVAGLSGGEQSVGSGAFQYQNPFGRYEARYDRFNGQDTTLVSVSGGVVALGGTVLPTRAVGGAYALIRVPYVQGVTGLYSNQPIARTDRRGDVLVPELLPYYGNRLAITPSDLPLDYEIETTEKVVAPPYRGGAVVTFPVRRLRSLRGTMLLRVNGRDLIPAFGELKVTVEGESFTSPLGSQGEFYLENMPAGPHPAAVESGAGDCLFTLEVPLFFRPILDIGPLGCSVSRAPQGAP